MKIDHHQTISIKHNISPVGGGDELVMEGD